MIGMIEDSRKNLAYNLGNFMRTAKPNEAEH